MKRRDMTLPALLVAAFSCASVFCTSAWAQNTAGSFEWVARSEGPHCKGGPSLCVGADHRAVRYGNGELLLFTYSLEQATPLLAKLTAGSAGGVSVGLLPLSVPLTALPNGVKQAILNSVQDVRVWPAGNHDEPWQNTSARMDARPSGIPTSLGLMNKKRIAARQLTYPDGNVRNAADERVYQLFSTSFANASFEAATLGSGHIVFKDRRYTTTRVAVFDIKTGLLKQDLKLAGIPDKPACSVSDTQAEHVFNDTEGNTYLLRGRPGRVFKINEQLQASLVAVLPVNPDIAPDSCGPTHNQGAVLAAARLASGQLVVTVGLKTFVQQGSAFKPLQAPPGIVQLWPVGGQELLAIAEGGLAKLRVNP